MEAGDRKPASYFFLILSISAKDGITFIYWGETK